MYVTMNGEQGGGKHITESPAVPFIKRPERRGKVRSDREKRGGRGTRGGRVIQRMGREHDGGMGVGGRRR